MSAAQDTATNGAWLRGLSAWMARASSSLPVPLSPRTRMVELLRAAVRARSNTACIAGLLLIRSRKWYSRLSTLRSSTFSRTRACCVTIFWIIRLSSSGSNGFTR